jgi:hypothetical protein
MRQQGKSIPAQRLIRRLRIDLPDTIRARDPLDKLEDVEDLLSRGPFSYKDWGAHPLGGQVCDRACPRESLKPVDVGRTGIDAKRPVFAGACKACPWGVLAAITQAAMKPYGYNVESAGSAGSTTGRGRWRTKRGLPYRPGLARIPRRRTSNRLPTPYPT